LQKTSSNKKPIDQKILKSLIIIKSSYVKIIFLESEKQLFCQKICFVQSVQLGMLSTDSFAAVSQEIRVDEKTIVRLTIKTFPYNPELKNHRQYSIFP
jgi:hypothetical protein